MAESQLLNIARARDSVEFQMRVQAALQVQAQAEELVSNASAASRWLADKAFSDPAGIVQRILTYAASDPAVSSKIKVTGPGNAIDLSEVLDADIQTIIAKRWGKLADFLYARERSNITG